MPDPDERTDELLEAGLILASELSTEKVLQRIVELAVSVTGAKYGALGVLGSDGSIEQFITVGVSAEERARIGDPPSGKGILGVIIETQSPLRLSEIGEDPRSIGFPANHPPMHSLLGAPVKARGKTFGNIYLTEKQGAAEFDEADEHALLVLASQAGVAVENAFLYDELQESQAQLRDLAVLRDRERIAKELHDGVIQSLFAIGMGLQAASAGATDDEISSRIESSVEEIDVVIRDLRNYIFGLGPGILADRRLEEAIRELAAEFADKTGVAVAVQVDSRVAGELASVAADIVQLTREALSNVGRHAEAETCAITLVADEHGALLEVDDDGKGFEDGAARPNQGGQGLKNIRDRVQDMGGDSSVTSKPGEGTTLRVRIPLRPS
jgi:signal transduction histidine kinase